jgi:hypothetical protein
MRLLRQIHSSQQILKAWIAVQIEPVPEFAETRRQLRVWCKSMDG